MARRFFTAEQAAIEVMMDDDSGDEDMEDEDSTSEDSEIREETVVEDIGDAHSDNESAHSAFVFCMRENNRNRRASSTRGRGRIPRGRLIRPTLQYVWTEDTDFESPTMPEFTANPGVKADIDPEAPPRDYFNLFVDDGVFERMVEETNKYADQLIQARGDQLKKDSLLAHWTPVTVSDIKVFLGLLFAMGIEELPDIKCYWSTHPIFNFSFFSSKMSRNRFESILMCFHLNDNTTNLPREHPDHDKLFKVRPLFDHLKSKFASVCVPGRNIAVDESMIPWRGRVAFRMFIPNKPIRYGLKLYLCCDSETSYVSQMELYTGRKGENREKDHGPNVVHRLTEPFKGQGYTVFVDSFFSSVPLFRQLRENNTTATGTIRKDRVGLPPDLKQRKVKKGDIISMKTDIPIPSASDVSDPATPTMYAFRYNDKKDVTLLSTCSTAKMTDTGRVDKRTNQRIRRPQVVNDYNQNMNAVDNFDQNIHYYSFNRKTWKWWKRCAFHLLHLAKVQSYLIWKMMNPQGKTTQLQFTMSLIMELTEDGIPAQPFKRRLMDPPSRLMEKHYPSKVQTTGKRKRPCRVCCVCSVRNEDGKGYKKKKGITV